MRFVGRVSIVVSILMLISALAAAVAFSGPQHMACPSCYDLEKIASNVYVEHTFTNKQRARMLRDLKLARKRVAAFFGPLQSNPRIVVCRSRACAGIFGSQGAKGVAYGWFAILLSPSRIFAVIAAHELVHIELHWRMGLSGWARGTVPVWFDEGLASIVSGDPRYRQDANANAVREVMQIRSFFGEWQDHTRRVGWRTAYRAAATRVRQLERRIGREKLKSFVARLLKDGDLAGLLQHLPGEPDRPLLTK
jgi:hypothetical protein